MGVSNKPIQGKLETICNRVAWKENLPEFVAFSRSCSMQLKTTWDLE